ncbi:Uncharacterised protein [Vibrio cholerae]|nr:Uncharacterised protein [Vibrio cholerae]CSC35501.1 Uncharacterised protein [Vibrio cholerae]
MANECLLKGRQFFDLFQLLAGESKIAIRADQTARAFGLRFDPNIGRDMFIKGFYCGERHRFA